MSSDVTDSYTGKGNRRIDRVLAEDFLAGLPALPLSEVRSLRREAEQEETDLSYLRRLIHGRADIITAELGRRDGDGSLSLMDALPRILADEPRQTAYGLGRHTAVAPSRADSHRRHAEALVADVDLSDVGHRDGDELRSILVVLAEQEQRLSAKRTAVQSVMDACSAEITRRYREGEADVASLLAES